MKRFIPLFLLVAVLTAVCGVHAYVPDPAEAYSFESSKTLVPPSLSGWIICHNDPINRLDPDGAVDGPISGLNIPTFEMKISDRWYDIFGLGGQCCFVEGAMNGITISSSPMSSGTMSFSGSGSSSGESTSNNVTSENNDATGSLDWSVVNKKGEGRVQHVSKHGANNVQKLEHGVFNNDPVETTNNAWANKGNVQPINENGVDIYHIPFENAGYAGGTTGNGQNLNYVTIITKQNSNEIITAYPSAAGS